MSNGTTPRWGSSAFAASIIMWAIFGPIVLTVAGLILAGGYKAVAWVAGWGCP
jgi:hypothetical protein